MRSGCVVIQYKACLLFGCAQHTVANFKGLIGMMHSQRHATMCAAWDALGLTERQATVAAASESTTACGQPRSLQYPISGKYRMLYQ